MPGRFSLASTLRPESGAPRVARTPIWEGAALRYPDGLPDTVAMQLRHELNLIERLQYAPYFLTVDSIVRFARSKNILCQGRGSAANSAVCFMLGITAIDPVRQGLLFERFVSEERREPPDIDVDFEHERREEVIQWVFETYGLHRSALTAVVTGFRGRGAVREVGNPYLRRREGKEPVVFPKPELEKVLGKTLGVPLFQEQAMQVAMVAARFSATEADQLRRAMATFKHTGGVNKFRNKLITGMIDNGYDQEFAERTFRQLEGFGSYGFPESHAASFALIAYASSWMKCHHPDVFCAALLNAQPMGFYSPAQLVRDARQYGVEVRPIDVNASAWDCTLEPLNQNRCAVRLGLRTTRGLAEKHGLQLVAACGSWREGPEGLPSLVHVAAVVEAFFLAWHFRCLCQKTLFHQLSTHGVPESLSRLESR
jgi:DNA polymerase III alpha subunit